MSEVFCFVEEL